MGDTLSPRGSGPEASPAPQPPAPQAPQTPQAPGVYPPPGLYAPPQAGPPLALTVAPPRLTAVAEPPAPEALQAPAEPPPDRYAPDPKPRSPVWEAIKWPLRKALLGIYLGIQAARRHKLITLGVVVLLVALIGAGGVVYELTALAPPKVTIERPDLPALPASVLHYLHGEETFNAKEVWDSLDPDARTASGATEGQLQAGLDQARAQGNQTTRIVYSGGYRAADGTSHYTIEIYGSVSGQPETGTLYIVVGTNGLITRINAL
jgi:hypothetical protein